MQKFLEATGESRDAAIANALRQLGLDRDDVSVEVLDNGKKGIFGIGATPARVRVTYEAPEIIEEKKPAPKAEKPAPKPVKTEPKAEKPAVKPQKLSITDEDDTPRLVKAAPADFVPEKLEVEREEGGGARDLVHLRPDGEDGHRGSGHGSSADRVRPAAP